MSAWIDIVAIAVPLLAAGLLGAGLRGPLPHAALPLLFALMVTGIALGYVAAAHGQAVAGGAAAAGAVAAMLALAAAIFTLDAQLAAAGAGPGGLGDTLLLAGLPRSAKARWRSFERDLWAYIAAHNPGRGSSSDDD
ncbi:MAG TPA: hypothetical protein VN635_07310 [Conexibacter sp.]|nr:hypothetical protein [Conexibacter sp.]